MFQQIICVDEDLRKTCMNVLGNATLAYSKTEHGCYKVQEDRWGPQGQVVSPDEMLGLVQSHMDRWHAGLEDEL